MNDSISSSSEVDAAELRDLWLSTPNRNAIKRLNSIIELVDAQRAGMKRHDDLAKIGKELFFESKDAIMITDHDGIIVSINNAFEQMSGYKACDILGKKPRILSSGQHSSDFYSGMQEKIALDDFWSGEIVNQKSDGAIYRKHLFIFTLRDGNHRPISYVSVYRDEDDSHMIEEKVRFLTFYDGVTGLPNRSFLGSQLVQSISFAQRRGAPFAVLLIDIDRFKIINDVYGHTAGDRLLKIIARRMKSVVRDIDTVARISGDEFVILLQDTTADGASDVAKNILEVVVRSCNIGENCVSVSASIGIAAYPDHGKSDGDILHSADTAMYHAKKSGRGHFQIYAETMRTNAGNSSLFSMEREIGVAIEKQQFYLDFQPQVLLSSGAVCGAEALIRWKHPLYGFISPADFIPVAEESGQILLIGQWVILKACEVAAKWHEMGCGVPVGINVSVSQLMHSSFVDSIVTALRKTGLPHFMLEIEITERVMMEDPVRAAEVMSRLRGIGIGLSIDDFGTGFSSLSYIKTMPITRIKIDKSFVDDSSLATTAIIEAIVALSRRMGVDVIAEGTETREQIDRLIGLGCEKAQGYFFSKPLGEKRIAEYLLSHRDESKKDS